jgi:hypothetical protein
MQGSGSFTQERIVIWLVKNNRRRRRSKKDQSAVSDRDRLRGWSVVAGDPQARPAPKLTRARSHSAVRPGGVSRNEQMAVAGKEEGKFGKSKESQRIK